MSDFQNENFNEVEEEEMQQEQDQEQQQNQEDEEIKENYRNDLNDQQTNRLLIGEDSFKYKIDYICKTNPKVYLL